MSISSDRKYMVVAAAWSPDAKEFDRGILDQICNVIPVFGSHRTLQKLHRLSACDEPRRVTGTFVHRLSIDQSLDLMQPNYSDPRPVLGFQSVPKTQEYYQALRGFSSDTSTTILLVGQGAVVELFGTFEMPHANAWDAINDLVVSFVYRINTGFTGLYDFTVEVGVISPITDPPLEANYTALVGGTNPFNKAGNLAVDGDGAYVNQQITIPNASLPATPQNALYAFKIIHDTPLSSATDEFFDPVEVRDIFGDGKVFGWKDQDGSDNAGLIKDAIEGEIAGVFNPDLTDYAVSRVVWSTENQQAVLIFRCDLPTFINLQNHKISFKYSLGSTAQFLILRMYQGIPEAPGSFVIQQWGDGIATIGVAAPGHEPGTPATTFNITDVLAGSLEDVQNWDDVWFALFVTKPNTPLTTTTDYGPDPDGLIELSPGSWNTIGAGNITGDASDATYYESPINTFTGNQHTPHAFYRQDLLPSNYPKEAIGSVQVRVRTRTIGGFTRMNIGIENGDTGLGWFSVNQGITYTNTAGGPFAEIVFQLSVQGIAQITNWSNVRVVAVVMDDSTGQVHISEVKVRIVTGFGSEAKIYGFSYIGPGLGDEVVGAPIDISYMRADGPAAVSAAAGDKLRAYIGTVEDPQSATQVGKIYELDSPDFQTWNDVSDAGGYDSNVRDKSWHINGYGEIVVATNYSDPVQRKMITDAAFSPLIGFDTAGVAIAGYVADGGVYPRARFVAPINAFLCLANCDPTSVAGIAQPYTFWSSRYSQPQYYAAQSLEWQSAAFQLVATAGEITGLVGGEYGIVFKECSIMRAEYVQLPEVFDFPFITRQQGTLFPRSIVAVDDDVYFIGIGGIFRVRAGQVVEPLLEGVHIRKFMFDNKFEEFAITSLISSLESENSARVIGGYEAVTGCVFWAIHTEANGDDWFMCDAVIVFSPTEGRFTLLRGDATGSAAAENLPRTATFFPNNSLRIGGFLTLGNRSVSAETYILKTLLAVNNIPPEVSTWGENRTYEFFFRSNTVPASQFPNVDLGQEVILHGVRPVFGLERRKIIPPYTIYIEANQSPVIDDGMGEQRVLSYTTARSDGRVDIDPLSGEFFKFALMLEESEEPIVKEFLGWQVWYEPAGDH
jgi:hypothetical protein